MMPAAPRRRAARRSTPLALGIGDPAPGQTVEDRRIEDRIMPRWAVRRPRWRSPSWQIVRLDPSMAMALWRHDPSLNNPNFTVPDGLFGKSEPVQLRVSGRTSSGVPQRTTGRWTANCPTGAREPLASSGSPCPLDSKGRRESEAVLEVRDLDGDAIRILED